VRAVVVLLTFCPLTLALTTWPLGFPRGILCSCILQPRIDGRLVRFFVLLFGSSSLAAYANASSCSCSSRSLRLRERASAAARDAATCMVSVCTWQRLPCSPTSRLLLLVVLRCCWLRLPVHAGTPLCLLHVG